MTQLEVRDEGTTDVRHRSGVDEDDGTRLKGPVVIRSQMPSAPPMEGTTSGGTVDARGGAGEGTVQRSAISADGLIAGVGAVAPVAPRSVDLSTPRFANASDVVTGPPDEAVAPASAAGSGASSGSSKGRPNRLVVGAAALLAVVIALFAVRLISGPGTDDDRVTVAEPTRPTKPVDRLIVTPVSPTNITRSEGPDGRVTIAWVPVRPRGRHLRGPGQRRDRGPRDVRSRRCPDRVAIPSARLHRSPSRSLGQDVGSARPRVLMLVGHLLSRHGGAVHDDDR
jgi:hypothetical protein